MVKFSSHILNSVNGTHSASVPIKIEVLYPNNSRLLICEGKTDEGGRFKNNFILNERDTNYEFEMIVSTKDYFKRNKILGGKQQMLDNIVVRFLMPNKNGAYHIPLIISPNGYSIWAAGE